MAQPVQYFWSAVLTNPVIAGAQTATKDVPLVLVLGTEIPQGNVRQITINSNEALTAEVIFDVIGLDEFSNLLPVEKITIAETKQTNTSTQLYSKILSITPLGTPAGISTPQISANYSTGGATPPFLCDVWNKNALYSYTVVQGTGNLKVTPQYSLDPLPKWNAQGLSGQQPVYSASWINITTALVASGGGSFSDFPITAIRFLVDSENTASFTATILQQGGYY